MTLIVWILAGFLDFPFFLAFIGFGQFLQNYFILSWMLHGISYLLFLLYFFRRTKVQDDQKIWERNFLFFGAVLPCFGWILMAVLHFFRFPPRPVDEKGLDISWVPSEEIFATPSAGDQKRERVLKELDFIPISEIMAGKDIALKRGAIERLAQLKAPEAILLLESYRTDENVDVRFFVNIALGRVKKEFEEEMESAKEEVKKDIYKLESRVLLADTYLRYAQSKLLDPTTSASFIEEALYHLQFCAMDEGASARVFLMLVDVYSAREEWDKVMQVVAMLENRKMENSEDLAQVKAKALYALQEYPKLISLFKGIRAQKKPLKSMQTMADWWGGV